VAPNKTTKAPQPQATSNKGTTLPRKGGRRPRAGTTTTTERRPHILGATVEFLQLRELAAITNIFSSITGPGIEMQLAAVMFSSPCCF
jgi:hypothetical protein